MSKRGNNGNAPKPLAILVTVNPETGRVDIQCPPDHLMVIEVLTSAARALAQRMMTARMEAAQHKVQPVPGGALRALPRMPGGEA